MLRTILATIILYPYFPFIWKLLSFTGAVFTFWFIAGFLLVYYRRKPTSFRPIQSLNLIAHHSLHLDYKSRVLNLSNVNLPTKSESNNSVFGSGIIANGSVLAQFIQSILKDLAIQEFSKNDQTAKLLNLFSIEAIDDTKLDVAEKSSTDSSLIDEQIGIISKIFIDVIQSLRSVTGIYDKLWINFLNVFQHHVEIYKKFRKEQELLQKPSQNTPIPKRHLDDFNEFSVESEDFSLKWSNLVDKVHANLAIHLRVTGELHSAVGKTNETEIEYLRESSKKLLDCLRLKGYVSQSIPDNVLQIAFREWVVCRALGPLANRMANPDVCNAYLLEKLNRRLIVQKAIKTFYSQLETCFTHFPPLFLSESFGSDEGSLAPKHSTIQKIATQSRSMVDLNCIKHEVYVELKRKRDEAADLKVENFEEAEKIRSYIRILDGYYRKVDKRLNSLLLGNVPAGRQSETTKPNMSKPDLSLNTLLAKYLKASEDFGLMHSNSLFHFMDFLEKRKDSAMSICMLRFWAACERYRRLIWRIGNGMVADSSKGVWSTDETEQYEHLTVDAHVRLRKEVAKIYGQFLDRSIAPETLIEIDGSIRQSYERYIAAELDESLLRAFPDDYLCVLRSQRQILQKLELIFYDFQNSESFFLLRSENQMSKLNQREYVKGGPNHLILAKSEYDRSVLLKVLLKELNLSCQRLTGQSKAPEPKSKGMAMQPMQDPSPLFTLDDMVILDPSLPINAEEHFNTNKDDEDEESEIHLPGEFLNNTSKLAQIEQNIDRVMAQIECIDLIQAKIISDSTEHDPISVMQSYIIERVKELFSSEIGDLTRQKVKYESQEQREILMQSQCVVTIEEAETVENESLTGNKKTTYYLIHVVQGNGQAGWTVKRRYSDFDALHHKLKDSFSIVNEFDLPGKTTGMWPKAKNEMRASRMKDLEKYLQRLIDNHEISKSDHLRNFLASTYKSNRPKSKIFRSPFEFDSDSSSSIKRTQQKLAKTFISIKDQALTSKMKSFIDGSKRALRNQAANHHSSTEQLSDVKAKSKSLNTLAINAEDDNESIPSEDESFYDDYRIFEPVEDVINDQDHGLVRTTGPLSQACIQCVLELFQFKESQPWLRQNAASMLLYQYLHSKMPLEAALSQVARSFLTDENLFRFLKRYKEFIINPSLINEIKPNTSKTQIRIELKQKVLPVFNRKFLIISLPDVFVRFLGAESCFEGATLLIEMLQSETFNKHLLFTLIDTSLNIIIQAL
ncbi:hypothetical protein BC833DRAFT_620829 [Globomyces pollinis-pini]|nr:hypothetical protein BC833DRAFT_620829 [Globomyces pollinis-pini]